MRLSALPNGLAGASETRRWFCGRTERRFLRLWRWRRWRLAGAWNIGVCWCAGHGQLPRKFGCLQSPASGRRGRRSARSAWTVSLFAEHATLLVVVPRLSAISMMPSLAGRPVAMRAPSAATSEWCHARTSAKPAGGSRRTGVPIPWQFGLGERVAGVHGIAWEGAAAHRCEMVITCGHGDQASAEDIVVIAALDTEA